MTAHILKVSDWASRPACDTFYWMETFLHDTIGASIAVFAGQDHIVPAVHVHVENNMGRLMLYIYTAEGGDEPTHKLDLTPDLLNLGFCLKCGENWGNHNGDGSCVED